MKLNTEKRDGVVLVTLEGRLDTETTGEFNRTVDALIGQNETRIVINLAGLNYLNSSGLSGFIHLAQQLKKRNGRLVLFGLTGSPADVFEAAQLGPLISLVETETEALKSIQSG